MGGEGSGNWYRFDKKATTDECHSVDVRYLHRKGLLTPRHWFSPERSRALQRFFRQSLERLSEKPPTHLQHSLAGHQRGAFRSTSLSQ